VNREYHRWYSPSLGRDMELLVFGHGGARAVVFPTSMGRYFEWEDWGMVGALGEQLERGWLQLYCVDSIDADSWYAKWKVPSDRARAHAAYDAYVRDEVLPLTWQKNQTPYLMTLGTSFGAYHAVTFALRYPHVVARAIGLSGLYDIRQQTDGYSDATVFHYNAADFVMGESDPERLAALGRLDLVLAVGRDDPLRAANEDFSGRLWSKRIWHALRVWDGWAHDWPFWRDMIRLYVSGHD
jgi:esterase/lipase superfamily enzyme